MRLSTEGTEWIRTRDGRSTGLAYGLALAMLAAVGAALFRPDLLVGTGPATPRTPTSRRRRRSPRPVVNKWREAAKRVEEDRGEPTGRRARVSVPPQLRHYADKRRFLAIQVAGWREENYDLPHDEAGLAELIRRGELVEVKPVTDDYILYGVGANASGEPLVHFDRRTGREVTLYPRWDVFDDARAAPAPRSRRRTRPSRSKRAEFRKTTDEDARRPQSPQAPSTRRSSAARAEVAALQRRIASDAAWYDDYDRRQMLVAEWELLQARRGLLGGRGVRPRPGRATAGPSARAC